MNALFSERKKKTGKTIIGLVNTLMAFSEIYYIYAIYLISSFMCYIGPTRLLHPYAPFLETTFKKIWCESNAPYAEYAHFCMIQNYLSF